MLILIDEWLKQSTTLKLLGVALTCVLLLGLIDYAIGPELSFSVFYTGPIMLAAWYGGRGTGLVIATASSGMWLAADVVSGLQYSHYWVPVWNTLVRLGFFVIILELLTLIRKTLELKASLADTDPLTGLPNRRAFQEEMARESARALRYPQPFTVAYIDLDNFKFINDSLGHDTGDELLKTVARTIQRNIRRSDTIARLGGDEFAALFPMADKAAAAVVIAKFHQKLLDAMQQQQWPVTFSIGAITFTKPMASMRDMLKAVDDLMYGVKKEGKNNTRHHQWPISDA